MRATMNRPSAKPTMPRCRVLHIIPSFYPALGYGGPISAVFELCRAQVSAGIDVRVLTSDADGERRLASLSNRWVTDFGVPTFYAPVRLQEDIAPSLLWHLPSELRRADLVHVSGLFSATSVLGLAMARTFHRPVVLSPHGSLMPWALRSGRGEAQKLRALRLLRPLLAGISGWHVSSKPEADGIALLTEQGHLPPELPVALVEYGIRPEDISTTEKAPTPNGPRIVVLGRIHPVKNLELALAAFQLVKTAHPEAELVIAGPTDDEAYRQRLVELARSLRVEASVLWLGLVGASEKLALLHSSSMLWLCSHMESFGMVVVESLAQGTPVVATQPTPWSILKTEQVGGYVESTPNAVAHAAMTLLSLSHEERQGLHRRCREFAAAHYAWPALESRLRSFYEACVTTAQSA